MLARWLPLEETVQVFFDGEAGRDGVQRRVRFDLGGVEVQILSPYQPRFDAHLYDLLEEAPEDAEAEALARASEVGVVGQRLVKVVAQVPTHREAVGRRWIRWSFSACNSFFSSRACAPSGSLCVWRPTASLCVGTWATTFTSLCPTTPTSLARASASASASSGASSSRS